MKSTTTIRDSGKLLADGEAVSLRIGLMNACREAQGSRHLSDRQGKRWFFRSLRGECFDRRLWVLTATCLLLLWSSPGVNAFVASEGIRSQRLYSLDAYIKEQTPSQSYTEEKKSQSRPVSSPSSPGGWLNSIFVGGLKPASQPHSNINNMTMTEMMTMSAVGTALSVGVVYTLATQGTPLSAGAPTSSSSSLVESAGDVAFNIVDAALPLSASDVVSVALGEGVAGLIGALASFFISLALSLQQRASKIGRASASMSSVVADGDYFLARAAAFPLLAATGLSPFVASIASVVFATVPYELVKIGSRRRQDLREETEVLQQLLMKQKQKERDLKANSGFGSISLLFNRAEASPRESSRVVDVAGLKPVRIAEDNAIDIVEIFSDITRWLAYDVLVTDFHGVLFWGELPVSFASFPGVEGALFGALATVVPQIYADVLYAYFGFGGDEKRKMIQSRSGSDWAALYLSRYVTGATLFAVYEAAQIPAKSLILRLVTGGVEGCLGSKDYNMCIEAYLTYAPPVASPAAEARAIVTSLVSLWQQLPDFNIVPH